MRQFKPGDKVICLCDHMGQFTKGKIYTVRSYMKNDTSDLIMIEIDDAGSHTNGWSGKFFKSTKQFVFEEQLKDVIND